MKVKMIWAIALLALPSTSRAELPLEYGAMSAVQKQEVLWNNVISSQYTTDYSSESALPTEESLLPSPDLLNPFYLLDTFFHISDEMPEGRTKLIHAYGSVAKVEFRVTSSRYTGIFKSGGIGLARLSIARMSTAQDSFIPGMAIKILVDQNLPVNFHVMNSVDGQGSDHFFFSRAFSNILPEPTSLAGKIIGKSFGLAVDLLNHYLNGAAPRDAGTLPLLQASQTESNGKIEGDPRCPYQIIFKPTGAVLAGRALENDFRKDLAHVPPGTELYEISVKQSASAEEEKIGVLVTQSGFVASAYGDTQLFFQHAVWSK